MPLVDSLLCTHMRCQYLGYHLHNILYIFSSFILIVIEFLQYIINVYHSVTVVYGSFAFTLIVSSLPLEVPMWALYVIGCFSFIFLRCAFPLLFLKMSSLLVCSHNFPFLLQSFKNPLKPLQSNFHVIFIYFPKSRNFVWLLSFYCLCDDILNNHLV